MAAMAHIQLKLFATLQKYAAQTPQRCEIVEGTTLREVVARLQIPAEKIQLAFIDGKRSSLEAALRGGERVGLFPPVGGG